MKHQLAQYNIARLLEPLDGPRLAEFMAALDPLNQLAEESPGFVWRHQTADGNSTAIRVRGDPMIIINFSVWEDRPKRCSSTRTTARAGDLPHAARVL